MNQLLCPLHAQPFSRICIDYSCDQQSFLCNECFKIHTCPRYDIQIGIEEFAKKLNVNLTQFEKMSLQLKQLDFESFPSYIKVQKQKISDDISKFKKEIIEKCNSLETKLLDLLDEQINIYNKNANTFKTTIKETEKFTSLQKASQLSMLNIKLQSHNDPINVMKKLKTQLNNYYLCINNGKLKQYQENLILLQSQTVFPPTYKSQDFEQYEFNKLVNYFVQYLMQVETQIKQHMKYFPITDFEQKNNPIKQINKEQKIIEEDQCITCFLVLSNYLIYCLNDLQIKIRDKQYNLVESILCETQINCMIQLQIEIQEQKEPLIINKSQDIEFEKTIIALGGDDYVLIWIANQNSIIEYKKIKHQKMSRIISLLNYDTILLIGDWDGQIFAYDENFQSPIYIIDTQTTILFSLLKCQKFVIASSKCDMEQGGILFYNFKQQELQQEKRLKIQSVQKVALSNECLYIVDNKQKLFIYDCKTIELIKSIICSESFVNEIAIDQNQQILYILNQTCLKSISDSLQWNYQNFEEFPCLQCRQYYQSCRLYINNGMMIFIRHLHSCKHEQGDDDKCLMKTTLFIIQ